MGDNMDFRSVFCVAALAASVVLGSSAANSAPVPLYSAFDPPSPIDGITWSVTPSNYLHAAYYTDNLTPQDPTYIDTVLSSWFGLTLTLVSNADGCGTGGLACSNSNHTLNYTGAAANVFGIHVGQAEFAFYYTAPITTLQLVLSGTGDALHGIGISNIRSFCSLSSGCGGDNEGPPPTETPLPAALPLFASVIGGGWLAMRRRRKALKAAV
jgi:hypothetical protein